MRPSLIRSPFPDRTEFDIHAVDSPARVVTGDSYDFFFVNEDTLAILMADVMKRRPGLVGLYFLVAMVSC